MAGSVYLWQVYLHARRIGGNQWLLQMLAITSLPVTIVVVYVSFASYARLIDRPLPQPAATFINIVLVFLLACVVPYKALRIYWTSHGSAPPPEVPVTNGKEK